MYDMNLTIVGNLTRDPELRYTANGTAVTRFTVAYTPRTRSGNEWVDGEPTFMDCTAWRALAENIAESLTKGSRVIATGRLRTQRWESDGEKKQRLMVEVDAAGPELSWATARPARMNRSAGIDSSDPWATATPTRPTNAPTSPAPVPAAPSAEDEPSF